jgi:acyl dehydratase
MKIPNKPHNYHFKDLKLGQSIEFDVNFDESSLTKFISLSGDSNPLHTDSSYAKSAGFKDKVVHGCLVSSHLSRMAGMYIPGKRCLLLSMNVKWNLPVFIEDTVSYLGTISALVESNRACELKVIGTNQSNERVFSAKLLTRVLENE